MRLAIFIGCLITLILVSRWFMLSEDQEYTDSEVVQIQVTESKFSDSKVAPAKFDQPVSVARTPAKIAPKRLGEPIFGEGREQLSDRAKNVTQLIRAEYEVPKKTGKALIDLESQVLLEVKELPFGDPDLTRISVTTDWQTQKAISNIFSALYPNARQHNPASGESEIEGQQRSLSVAVD